MEYYQCEECGRRTLVQNAVHINNRMEFDTAFGTYRRTPYMHCCGCTEELGGQTCDHEKGLWQ